MKKLKHFLLRYIPTPLLSLYRSVKSQVVEKLNAQKTPREIFSDIYRNNKWGGQSGEFFSGAGSQGASLVDPYINMIAQFTKAKELSNLTFVDLGCGDFKIGSKLVPLCGRYIGVDVVEELISNHRSRSSTNREVSFINLDIISEPLPAGDVCFIRQVLQHLSNAQISSILDKLSQYRYVFITEQLPSPSNHPIPNLDMAHGAGIRLYRNSGVYLDKPPFSVPIHCLTTALELPGHGFSFYDDPGIIRTVCYEPMRP